MRACDSCHEPLQSAIPPQVKVGKDDIEHWCDLCVSQSAYDPCAYCTALVSSSYAYEISHRSKIILVCPECLIGFAMNERFLPIRAAL